MLLQMLLPETALILRQIPLCFTSDLLSYTQHPLLTCILLILLSVFLKQLTLLNPPLLNCQLSPFPTHVPYGITRLN